MEEFSHEAPVILVHPVRLLHGVGPKSFSAKELDAFTHLKGCSRLNNFTGLEGAYRVGYRKPAPQHRLILDRHLLESSEEPPKLASFINRNH
jgi:hypothetical protein